MTATTMEQPMENQIAIVGIGCRYGGNVDTVDKFWDMLAHGLDCTTPPPTDRFDCKHFLSPGEKLPGKIYSMRGGFLQQDPYMFDRKFFKIPPDEADHMDPQVRLLLEVTWEALEDSGIPASSVRGSQTGVYMGVTASEYAILTSMPSHNINQYSNSGTNSCMMANRVSYEFDFRGPSFSVDTACSSSLYAIHMACDALKNGSCKMAVAGGVNLILMTGATVGFCQAGMLAPDGRCKSFDDTGDGYSRSEGAGVIVLKKLTKAIQDGDRIYAVIRGGSLSNDGRTPGIATPSFGAQGKLIKAACKHADVNPHDIAYAEAHGTGTMVGDKTEANALGQVLRGVRQGVAHAPPLFIGSVKSNIGHSEGAAGVAGIIKTALSLKHRQIPQVVHFNTPNRQINVKDLNICFPKELTTWPEDRPLLATCSSFGFGGANANLVLTGPPISRYEVASDTTMDTWKPRPLLLSAASKEGLQQRLKHWETFLQKIPKTDHKTYLSALYTAAQRSHHHQHRLGLAVSSPDDAMHQINHRIAGNKKARCEDNVVQNTPKQKTVFVFSGMGTQWFGMARELMQSMELFASIIRTIDAILQGCGAKWSLVHMLTEETNKEKINKTDIAQPCICAVQIGLFALWKARGLTPDAVVGHSVGEVAAAYAAGLLTLEDAVTLVYQRGKLLSKTSGSGKMLAVLHPSEKIQERLLQSSYGQLLDIAADNSPNQVVLSGTNTDIDGFADELKTERVKCVKLKVVNAFHSRYQDSIQRSFVEKVSTFLGDEHTEKNYSSKSNIPMMSSVTGRYITMQEVYTSEYWWSNTRNKVRFKDAVENLIRDGHGIFIEVGSHAALLVAIQDTFDNLKNSTPPAGRIITTGSLIRPRGADKVANDSVDLLLSHVRLHVAGVQTTFESYFEASYRNVISVPLYPWQRERCSAVPERAVELFQFPVNSHPLLGEPQVSFIAQSSLEKVWTAELNESTVPWLKDHVIGGAVILPAAAYVETALAAARDEFPEHTTVVLRNVDLQKFMFAREKEAIMETTMEEDTGRSLRVTIRSHDKSTNKWTQHGRVNIAIPRFVETKQPSIHLLDIGGIIERCRFPVSKEEFYANESSVGLTLGPAFRSHTRGFVNEDFTEILCYCDAPENVWFDSGKYSFHPALMDSCFQPYAVLLFAQGREEAANIGTLYRPLKRVPRSIKEFCLYRPPPRHIIVHLVTIGTGSNGYCDVKLADAETGEMFCELDCMVFDVFESEGVDTNPHIWQTEWVNVPLQGVTLDESQDIASDEEEEEEEDEQSNLVNGNIMSNILSDKENTEVDILDRSILVFPDKGGVSEIVTHVLSSFNIHIVSAGNDVEDPKKVIDQYYSPDGNFFTDIIVLKTLDMRGFNDISDITVPLSLEEFRKIQNPGPLFCVGLLQKLLEIPEEKRPRVLFVTQGAYDVGGYKGLRDLQQSVDKTTEGNCCRDEKMEIDSGRETTDPFLSSIHSLLITAVHEEPTLQAVVLDLPPSSTLQDNAQIMHSVFLHLPPDENIIACRYMMPEIERVSCIDALEWNLFSPRLTFQPTSDVKVKTANDNWLASYDPGSGHNVINVLPSSPQRRRLMATEQETNARQCHVEETNTRHQHTITVQRQEQDTGNRQLLQFETSTRQGHGTINRQGQGHGTIIRQGQVHGTISRQGQGHGTISRQGQGHGTINMQDQGHGTISRQDHGHGTISRHVQGHGTISRQAQQQDTRQVSVQIKSFCTLPCPDQTRKGQPDKLLILAGIIDDASTLNANNNQCNHDEPRDTDSCILAITNANEVSSCMSVEHNMVSQVPEGISCSAAVNLVSRFLPASILLKDALSVTRSTNVLQIGGHNQSGSESALTTLLGVTADSVKAILPSAEEMIDHTPIDGVTYLLPEHIADIEPQSDLLIIYESSTALPAGTMTLLLQKLKRSASVVFIQEDVDSPRCMYKLPSKIKFMTLDTRFATAVEGISRNELTNHLSELWRVLLTSPIDLCINCTQIETVSSLSLTSGILPDDRVISVTGEDVTLPMSVQSESWIADGEASYLVTGGTSGLGLSLVEWLVSRGAKHIFVLSRTSLNPETEAAFAKLQLQGTFITHVQGDVSDAIKLEEVIVDICNAADAPPLEGIFHFATTYQDGFIAGMTPASWNAVMTAKAYGALMLHQVSLKLGLSLKYFVMASSLISLIGNAGQANYCAANNFVNGLCRWRNTMRLPATVLCIGFLNTVGFAVRRGLITAAEENGFISVSPADVLGALSVALQAKLPEVVIGGPLTLNLFALRHRALMSQHFRKKQGTLSLLKGIFDDKDTFMGQSEGSLRQIILELPVEEARKMILSVLCNILSKQLGIGPDIEEACSPVSLGMDSLLASTLSQIINEQFEVTLGAVDFLNEGNTLRSLSNTILRKITRSADTYDASGLPKDASGLSSEQNVNQGQAVVMRTGKWVIEGPSVPSAILKMICFPPNGGGPSTYSSWPYYLSHHGIQLLYVQMPGWEGRENETPLTTLGEMTQHLAEGLIPMITDGVPFVLFGHSMGSLLAFEVSHALLTHGYYPHHMFLSSWYAPTNSYPHPEEFEVPKQVFQKLGQMLGMNGMKFKQVMKQENVNFSFLDDSVLNNSVLMSRMLPAVEVALRIAENYKLTHEKKVLCGITTFGGESDPFVRPDLLDDWQLQLEDPSSFRKFVFPGKHMYLLENAGTVLHKVKQVLLELGINLRAPNNRMSTVSMFASNDELLDQYDGILERVKFRERRGRSDISTVLPVYESRAVDKHVTFQDD